MSRVWIEVQLGISMAELLPHQDAVFCRQYDVLASYKSYVCQTAGYCIETSHMYLTIGNQDGQIEMLESVI